MSGYEALIEAFTYKIIGEKFEKTISVTANQTEQHEIDFPVSRCAMVLIQIVATSGTTDCDLSIHNNTNYDNTDMVFRAVTISINDKEPTGGRPAEGALPYEEVNEVSKLYVQTVENSGNDGALKLIIRYIGG